MKFAMLQFLLPLCFFLLAFNTQPLLADKLEPVVDMQDPPQPLQPGVEYYVWPLWDEEGGVTPGQIRNKTCPLYVIRDPYTTGSPVILHAPGHDYIPTLTNLIIEFNVSTTCNQRPVWTLSKERFVSAGGKSQGLCGTFQIEKLEGVHAFPFRSCGAFQIEKLEGVHAFPIYSFKFCSRRVPPLGPLPPVRCAPVGTYIDADGTKVLAVGDDVEDYYVRFKNVSATYRQNKNQAFSSA